MPDMLVRRFEHVSVSVKNKLYMIAAGVTQCEMFDISSQQFTFIEPIVANYSSFATEYVTVGNKIRIYNGKSLVSAVFDFEKEEWCEENELELDMVPIRLHVC